MHNRELNPSLASTLHSPNPCRTPYPSPALAPVPAADSPSTFAWALRERLELNESSGGNRILQLRNSGTTPSDPRSMISVAPVIEKVKAPSELLARTAAFLPLISEANQKLRENPLCEEDQIIVDAHEDEGDNDCDGRSVVEMDITLGVLEPINDNDDTESNDLESKMVQQRTDEFLGRRPCTEKDIVKFVQLVQPIDGEKSTTNSEVVLNERTR